MNRQSIKRVGRVITSFVLVVSLLAGGKEMEHRAKAVDNAEISNPVVVGEEVKWSCVYFGNYPQRELTKEADAQIYEQLSKNQQWDANNDVDVEGKKYHRVCEEDSVSTTEKFDWSDGTVYHYFAYEPIKWRVLSIEDSKVVLLSDQILDTKKYNEKAHGVTWQGSSIRSWLNGYDATQNDVQESYETKGFADRAFTAEEKSQILTGSRQNVTDAVYLLDATEASKVSYGLGTNEARIAGSSQYAQAMGAADTNASWWTASSGNTALSEAFVKEDGSLYTKGYSVAYAGIGVRVALTLDIKGEAFYSYAGTVTSDGTVEEVAPSEKPEDTPEPTPTSPETTAPVTTDTVEPGETREPGQLPTEQPIVTQEPVTPNVTGPVRTPSKQPQATAAATKHPTDTKQPVDTKQPEDTNRPTGTTVPRTSQTPVLSIAPTQSVHSLPTGGLLPQREVTEEVGTKFQKEDTKATYEILTRTGSTGTVAYSNYGGKDASVEIPDIVEYKGNTYYVVRIGSNCFKNQKTLKKVSVGNGVTTIGTGAFAGCSKLTRVKLSTKLTSIGAKAFQRCSSLTAVTIPAKVKTIGASTFAGCKNLKRITVKTAKLTAAKLGTKAFYGIYSKAKIKVPKGKVAAYKSIFSVKGKIGSKVKVK